MYATSGRKSYVFYMTNGSGKIKGYLDKGEWHVSGEVKVQMINTFSNTTVTKDIILDGTYELFKNPKKKGYHPLFFF